MKGSSWSGWEERLLRQVYASLPLADQVALFGRTEKAIRSRAKVLKISRGTRRPWSAEEVRLLRRLYADTPTLKIANRLHRSLDHVYARAKRLGLKKSDAYMNSAAACRLRRGDNVGAAYRFPPGHVPANKGLRRPGYAPGRMSTTQFKKGQRSHTWKPVGSLGYSKEGYLRRKISDTGYPPRDWVGVHILMWEEANGKVPPGHAVAFKDGNKRHLSLDNFELLSRAELMRRNTIHNLPPELKQVIQLTGALKRKLRKGKGAYGKEQAHRPTGPSLRNAGVA